MRALRLAIIACLLLTASIGFATPITWTSAGPNSGSATFDWIVSGGNTTGLKITLTNTTPTPGNAAAELYGIRFTLAPAPSLTLGNITTNGGIVDCANFNPCKNTTPGPYTSSNQFGGDWKLTGSGTYTLSALGNGNQQYGITNSAITDTASNQNSNHNPFLIGPVDYFISSGSPLQNPPDLSSVQFEWGTTQTFTPGTPPPPSVPEPSTLLMVGTAATAFAGFIRRKLS